MLLQILIQSLHALPLTRSFIGAYMKKIEQLPPLFSLEPLEQRLSDITKVIEQKTKALENAPAGSLRISSHGKTKQYYYKLPSDPSSGKYLSTPNESLVRALAQKSYDKKVLTALLQEKKRLEYLLQFYRKSNPEDFLLSYIQARRNIIEPITLPVEEYFLKWKPENIPPNPYKEKPMFKTYCGIYVRSKSEVMIADALYKNKIPFLYEFPLRLNSHTIFPDFLCLNPKTHQKVIWEHFGMMDEPKYASASVHKINNYLENGYFQGFGLLTTFEDAEEPLTPQNIEQTIKVYLKRKVPKAKTIIV